MGKKEFNEEEDEEGREIKKTFTKKSKRILRPYYFVDTPFRTIEKIKSLPVDQNPCIAKNPFSRKCQVGPELTEDGSNTCK